MRIHTTDWQAKKNTQLQRIYETMQESVNRTQANRICAYLFECMHSFFDGDPMDLTQITGSPVDVERLQRAWHGMCAKYRWGRRHQVRVKASLSRGLLMISKKLACTLNAQTGGQSVQFETSTSYQSTFDLHCCLPLRIRQKYGRHTTRYQVLSQLIDEVSNHLKSLSRQNMKRIGLLLDRMIFGGDSNEEGMVANNFNVREVIVHLRTLSAMDWLTRYAHMHRGQKISFDHFKHQLRSISLLHEKVLQSSCKDMLTIPIVRAAGRMINTREMDCRSSTSATTDANSTQSRKHAEYRALRTLLSKIKSEMVVRNDVLALANKRYAFTCAEVRCIVRATGTNLERVVVNLFLLTGLRIGGLSRIQWNVPVHAAEMCNANNIPSEMITIEKGRRVRRIRLSGGCRVLIARLYRERHLTSKVAYSSTYLFPSPHHHGKCVSTHYIWTLCRQIFARSGVSGCHAHPHSFRHTLIQMMFMRGATFESIAKFIGHANVNITSGVYGKLDCSQTDALMRMDDTGHDNCEKRSWERLYGELCGLRLYTDINEDEWFGVTRMAPKKGKTLKSNAIKREALSYRGYRRYNGQ